MSFRFDSVVFVSLFLFAMSACFHRETSKSKNEIRILIETNPASLDPRQSFDAIGQRIEMLAFRALTNLDENLNPVPDLSEKWRLEAGGTRVIFSIRRDLKNHEGSSITPFHVFRCLRNYLFEPLSTPHRSSFPLLRDLKLKKDELVFELSGPDPYFERNLSVLRYFDLKNDPDHPCRSPLQGEGLITNGEYRISPYPDHFDRSLRLLPLEVGAPSLVFEMIPDETSRLLKLVNHEADLVLNSFSPTKTDWISGAGRHGFSRIEREGTNTSYLAFNFRDPILRINEVRQAIAYAIDRASIVRYKLRNEAFLASSFLNPTLPEAISTRENSFSPSKAEKLLDTAGFPRGADGIRFHLKQKVTTNRDGLEIAEILREMLSKIGIAVELDPVEPAVFFASIRKGQFQFYMSRWVGVADGSILYRTLRTGVKDNRVQYSDPVMDGWLDQALQEMDLARRRSLLVKVQEKMLEDLPYFPLWNWRNTLILSDGIAPPEPSTLSLSGSYYPLRKLRFKVKP